MGGAIQIKFIVPTVDDGGVATDYNGKYLRVFRKFGSAASKDDSASEEIYSMPYGNSDEDMVVLTYADDEGPGWMLRDGTWHFAAYSYYSPDVGPEEWSAALNLSHLLGSSGSYVPAHVDFKEALRRTIQRVIEHARMYPQTSYLWGYRQDAIKHVTVYNGYPRMTTPEIPCITVHEMRIDLEEAYVGRLGGSDGYVGGGHLQAGGVYEDDYIGQDETYRNESMIESRTFLIRVFGTNDYERRMHTQAVFMALQNYAPFLASVGLHNLKATVETDEDIAVNDKDKDSSTIVFIDNIMVTGQTDRHMVQHPIPEDPTVSRVWTFEYQDFGGESVDGE
jgi:hypothetical protein